MEPVPKGGPLRALVSRADRHGLLRNVTVVMSGAMVAQALGLLAAPILTRLYEPAAYGAFGVFLAATGILVPVSAWGLESVIALPKADRRGAHVLIAALAAVAATSGLIAAVVFAGGHRLLAALRLEEMGPYLPLLPAYVLIGGANLTLGFWLVRTQRFGRLSSAKVAQSVGTVGTQLGLGFLAFLPGGLILGSLVGQIAATVAAGLAIPPHEARGAARLAVRARWGWVYRTYRDFPRLKVPQHLLASSTDALVMVGLSVAFSPAHAGYFALMRRVLSLPAELVGEAVRKALVPRVAETARSAPEELTRLLGRSSSALLAMTLLPLAVLVATGPWLFGVVLGAAWETAGAYARIVGIMVAVRFAAVPYLTSVPLLRLNHAELVAATIRFAATAVAFAIGAYQDDVTLLLVGFAAAGITSDAIVVRAVRRRLAAMASVRPPA
jgi:lipopolysaccharide exporter